MHQLPSMHVLQNYPILFTNSQRNVASMETIPSGRLPLICVNIFLSRFRFPQSRQKSISIPLIFPIFSNGKWA